MLLVHYLHLIVSFVLVNWLVFERIDVATTGDVRMGSEYKGTAIRLRKTKTGPNQWVQVHDKSVEVLLLALVSSVKVINPHYFLLLLINIGQVSKMFVVN